MHIIVLRNHSYSFFPSITHSLLNISFLPQATVREEIPFQLQQKIKIQKSNKWKFTTSNIDTQIFFPDSDL